MKTHPSNSFSATKHFSSGKYQALEITGHLPVYTTGKLSLFWVWSSTSRSISINLNWFGREGKSALLFHRTSDRCSGSSLSSVFLPPAEHFKWSYWEGYSRPPCTFVLRPPVGLFSRNTSCLASGKRKQLFVSYRHWYALVPCWAHCFWG